LLLSCNMLCTQWGGEKRRSHSRCKHTCNRTSTAFVLVLGRQWVLYIVIIKRKQRAEMAEAQASSQGKVRCCTRERNGLICAIFCAILASQTPPRDSKLVPPSLPRADRAGPAAKLAIFFYQSAAIVVGTYDFNFEVPLALRAVVLLLAKSSFLYIIISVRASPCPGLTCDKAARTGTRMVRGDTQPRMYRIYLYRGYPRCMN
jgi:hypothetical protein